MGLWWVLNTKKLSDYSINTDWSLGCQMIFGYNFVKKVLRGVELLVAGMQGLVHRPAQFGQVYGFHKQLVDAQAARLLG